MTKKENDATILLRLPADLKAALLRAAAINGRRITSEVNIRLQDSLNGKLPAPVPQTNLSALLGYGQTQEAIDPVGGEGLSELDRSMLAVFRQLPVEKQLALLSLFK